MDRTGPKPPPGFIFLQDALEDHPVDVDVNLIGVVDNFLPACQTRGTDLQMTFDLKDSSSKEPCFENGYRGGLRVKFFKKKLDDFPKIQGTGDVVALRGARIRLIRGERVALSSFGTHWTVYPAGSIPDKPSSDRRQMQSFSSLRRARSAAEESYAIALCNAQDRSTFTAPSQATHPSKCDVQVATPAQLPKDKFSLIKDIEVGKFYHLVVQVVRVYDAKNGQYTLYVSDYTTNSFLYDYEEQSQKCGATSRDGDDYGYVTVGRTKKAFQHWPGPWGKQTLQVTCFAPHDAFAREEVKVNDVIFLRNINIQFSSLGTAQLEGKLRTDREMSSTNYAPHRINISILRRLNDDDNDFPVVYEDRVRDLMKRKRDYWKKAIKRHGNFLKNLQELQKRELGVVENDANDTSRSNKRRKGGNKETLDAVESVDTEQPEEVELNKYVRCAHPAIRPLPVSEIINGNGHDVKTPNGIPYRLPFHNISCRASLRVVDFFPPNLADFAVPRESSEYEGLSDDGNSNGDDDSGSDCSDSQNDLLNQMCGENGTRTWEWRFCLCVEEGSATGTSPKERFKVFVSDRDAEYLLAMSAEDLRKNSTALAEVREKLFVLWGDLEERKTAAASRSALRQTTANKDRITTAQKADPTTPGSSKPEHSAIELKSSAKAFECCLKEYGVRVKKPAPSSSKSISIPRDEVADDVKDTAWTGWERRFRMFGTTIR